MFFYRRHQQSYYMFNDVTAKTRFMDLVDGGSTYASDILHFENISYVLGRHHGHGRAVVCAAVRSPVRSTGRGRCR